MNIVPFHSYFVGKILRGTGVNINVRCNIQLKTEEGTAEYKNSRQDIVNSNPKFALWLKMTYKLGQKVDTL